MKKKKEGMVWGAAWERAKGEARRQETGMAGCGVEPGLCHTMGQGGTRGMWAGRALLLLLLAWCRPCLCGRMVAAADGGLWSVAAAIGLATDDSRWRRGWL